MPVNPPLICGCDVRDHTTGAAPQNSMPMVPRLNSEMSNADSTRMPATTMKKTASRPSGRSNRANRRFLCFLVRDLVRAQGENSRDDESKSYLFSV